MGANRSAGIPFSALTTTVATLHGRERGIPLVLVISGEDIHQASSGHRFGRLQSSRFEERRRHVTQVHKPSNVLPGASIPRGQRTASGMREPVAGRQPG
jgi:hypothetical protein